MTLSFLESIVVGGALILVLLQATVLLGGAAFLPRDRTLWTAARLREALTRHGLLLGIMLGMVALFSVQAALDPVVTRWVGRDFTPAFAAVDGGLHAAVQEATPAAVEVFLAVVYLLAFPVVIYLTPILGAWLGDDAVVRRGFGVFAGLYLLALPFYFFFPVREVWTTGAAENLALLTPWTSTILYSFNDVNNAFPSMHTAMAIASAWAAWGVPGRAYRVFAVAVAVLIPISTIVLGIHWSLDVAAGVLAALLVIVVVRRLVPGAHSPSL